MNQDRLTYLLEQYGNDKASEAEIQELWAFIERGEDKELFAEVMAGIMEQHPAGVTETAPYAMLAEKALQADKVDFSATPPRRHFLHIPAWGRAAAAILLIAGATFFYRHYSGVSPALKQQAMLEAIAPGTNKAVLTLSDGSQVPLDSTGNMIIHQGDVAIRQQGGSLQYDDQLPTATVNYNTLTTPRGGQFRVVLPDGSGVLLNAASSIRYPTAFTGKERKVTITGEVYFEVAPRAGMPFRVNINDEAEIEVLGTSFNINAYDDEAAIKATLLKGSIRVRKGKESTVLSPGQQAQLQGNHINVIRDIDASSAVAWKDGIFNFNGAGTREVMRQISRWYDIEVVYEPGTPDIEFAGEMSRDEKISSLLKGFEKLGMHFHVEKGKRIVVTP
ncbi:iron dicitrate transport regulator FecR [Chitinophaga caeni]|uniref:Iron dicitrate transport regulator FecR n=1 Tax=Chitinophaga caeni TaxID=2029983 RepID=A0A291QQR0_9BACT|nr:FecR family protein [Chitinophaga caeni]ATL46174.1 iron dicitrate transport regulator FecR [Chitinophaga caeni]